MIWPFLKKREMNSLLKFTPEGFFKTQCKIGHTDIVPGTGIVAIVLDEVVNYWGDDLNPKIGDLGQKIRVHIPVRVDSDGGQIAFIKVASDDGGFIVGAGTATNKGDRLKPGDIVLWVPLKHVPEMNSGSQDTRTKWAGLIVAKVAPEYDFKNPAWKILCRYD